MPKVRLLQILEATIGGTRKHVLQILKYLPRDSYELSLVCSTLRDPSFVEDIEALRADGVNVTVIQMTREINPLADFRALFELARHMREHSVDVVHTHSSKAGVLGRIAARLADVPRVVHSPHAFAFEFRTNRPARMLYRLAEKFCARLSDAIVAVSEHERQQAIGLNVLSPDKVLTIENGLDEDDFKRSRRGPQVRKELGIGKGRVVVGTVGRLAKQKGLTCLVDAAAKLLRDFPDLCFLVAGAGEQLLALERKLIDLRIGKKVLLLGHRDDTRDLYAAMDIFVLPSLWEGRPYALLEAMAAGKPVVASDVCGLDEVIENGKNGVLVRPGDVPDLADGIARLVKSPPLRRKLGQAARKTVEARYHAEESVARLHALYTELAVES